MAREKSFCKASCSADSRNRTLAACAASEYAIHYSIASRPHLLQFSHCNKISLWALGAFAEGTWWYETCRKLPRDEGLFRGILIWRLLAFFFFLPDTGRRQTRPRLFDHSIKKIWREAKRSLPTFFTKIYFCLNTKIGFVESTLMDRLTMYAMIPN